MLGSTAGLEDQEALDQQVLEAVGRESASPHESLVSESSESRLNLSQN
jgi:hypothetical protein